MLKIFNDLEPFFLDNYRRINIREYARIRKISAPSASTLLNNLENEGLLNKEVERNYVYYFANNKSELFINLSRIYWLITFRKVGLIEHLEKELINPLIILFGSFCKAELKNDSDIDLAIFTISNKIINIKKFEDKLKRKVQLFVFKNKEEVKNKELLNNILNGFIIASGW
ncbi:MAG: nucleotidyltransferase domain-containing protein [Nanoarchaeota archaeon]